MREADWWVEAVLLGLIEGVTEFLPISSTGHLILVGDLLGFVGTEADLFKVVIQFGAILAVLVLYARRFTDVALALPSRPEARAFVLALVLGVVPALVLGVAFHGFIKSVLFSPWVVAVALVAGGVLILVIERMDLRPVVASAEAISPWLALKIGVCQSVAMIPGVSRSGATILGAMLLGVERRAAAEFSFFLAIPTMLAAASYDLYKNRELLSADGALMIAVGFAVAFVSAALVVRALLAYLQRHTFTPFGWYRIALGLVMIGLLLTR